MNNDILVKIGADITDFSRKMNESNKALSNFGKANKATFDAFKTTGKIVTGAGIALAGGLGLAVKTAADFESSMSRVGALSGATDAEMTQLTQTAKDLGASTVFSASEAAEGMSYLAMAGFETNEIVSAMPGLLNLAAAGQIDLGSAADITSNILSGFGIEASKTGEVADVLTKTFTSSNTTMQSLGESFKMLAPTANALGVPIEDAAAAVGILGDAGIQGSMAGSQLSMALTRLSSPSSQAADVMKDLGFSAFDSSGNMKSLEDIVRELTDSTSDLTEEQRMHAISTIFGAQSMKSILTLMDAGADTLGEFTDELRNSGGAAQEIADKQLDNFNGQIVLLKSALEGAAISIGSALLPALKVLVNVVQWLVDKFNGLSDGVKSFIAIGAGLTAVFALIVGPIMLLIGFIPNIIAGFSAIVRVIRTVAAVFRVARSALLGFSGPIGWITAGVIALATIIFKYWTPIKKFFVNLWGSVSKAFVNGFNAIDGATHGWLRNAINVYKSFYNAGIDIFKRYWHYVKETWSNALDFLKALIRLDFGGMKDAIGSQMSAIKSLLGDSWTIIKDNMAKPLTALSNSVRNTFSDLYSWLNDKTDGFFGHYVELITAWGRTARDVFKSGWTYIKETFSNALEFLKGLITLDFGRMNDAIQNHLEAGRTLITDIWASIKDNVIVKLWEISEALGEKLSGWKDLAVEKLSDMGAGIVKWFESMPDRILDKLSSWDTAITDWFETRPAAIEEQLVGWGRTIESWFIEQKDSFLELMQTWGETILGWFETVPNEIAPQLDEWGTTISEWFDNMPEVILTSLERWRKVMVEWTEKQDKENKEQFESWKETIREWFDTVPGLLKDKLSDWKDTISDKFKEMKELVSDRLDEWKEVIFAWYDEQPGNIRSSLADWWKAFGKWMSEIPAKITTKLEDWWDAFKTWLKNLPNKPEVKNAGENMIDKVAEGNEAKRDDFISKLGRLIIDVAKAALAMAAVAIFAVGRELIRDLISGLQSMSANLYGKMSDIGSGMVGKVMGFFNDMVTAGKSLIAGLVNGIKQMGAQAVNAITGVVDGVVSKAKSLLKIKSPSRVFAEIGEFTGMGLVRGMDASKSAVERATERMTIAATPDIDMSYDTPGGIRSSLTSAVNGTVDVSTSERDSALIGVIGELRRDLTNLRVEMEGETVGRIVRPHVNEGNALDASVRYFD